MFWGICGTYFFHRFREAWVDHSGGSIGILMCRSCLEEGNLARLLLGAELHSNYKTLSVWC